MKKTIITITALTLMFISSQVLAGQYVRGYYRSDGSYVQGYHRSSPNGTQYDNYSTKGNVNPSTGEKSYKTPKWQIAR